MSAPWDYLIVTAANAQQAAAYNLQIRMRRDIGHLPQVRRVLVVADAGGCRIGSGGSTMQSLREVLRLEGASPEDALDAAEEILRRLRILIVHAGGDSRRLPAYSPCGKIFVPLPGDAKSSITPTLFDRLVPAFLDLPQGARGRGQIVVASGDALILFDPSQVDFSHEGITALGTPASPDEAARHGVLCPSPDGRVRLYLQKPSIAAQVKAGAIGKGASSILDVGIMSLDAGAAARLLGAFGTPPAQSAILSHGVDLYREICCALGTEATFAHYLASVRASGSHLDEALLAELFRALHSIPLNLETLSECHFLHFGSTNQLISSGIELMARDGGVPPANTVLSVSNDVQPGAGIAGTDSWVEGCRLQAPLTLRGRNVLVGVDVDRHFELPEGACLDVSPGHGRRGEGVWFIRYYGVADTFKHALAAGATFCGMPLIDWLRIVGVPHSEIWPEDTPANQRMLWNARVSPAEMEPGAYTKWSWMLNASLATLEQTRRFLAADRYSSAEIALRVDQDAFHQRRAALRVPQ